MKFILECKPFFSECMQMYILISGGLIALNFYFTKITHVCIEECLFKVYCGFHQLYFKSKDLGNVSILINICFFSKTKMM